MCKICNMCKCVLQCEHKNNFVIYKGEIGMQTKLDYNREQYNVVVRKELKTPFVTEVEVVFTPINNHRIVRENLSGIKNSSIMNRLHLSFDHRVYNIHEFNHEDLTFKYTGELYPEDIVELEDELKKNQCFDKEVVNVQKDKN